MILQNTTFVIDEAIEEIFLDWLRSEFVPAAAKSGSYEEKPRLHLILANAEPGTKNYAFQLQAARIDDARAWLGEGEGAALLAAITRRLDGRMAHFSTYMDEIEL